MDVDPSGRFFVNPYRELVDPAAIVPGVRDFLVNANQILTENLQSLSKNDLCLYTGSVGVAITLSRLKNHASISSQTDGRREYPELRGSKSGIDRHGLGLCSNELCYSMYRCLQEGRPFEIDRNVYTNRGECDEVLYGRSGLLVMLDYFTKRGMQTQDPELISKVAAAIDLNEYPWYWHGKVYYGGAHGTAGILFTLKRVCGIEQTPLVEKLVAKASMPSGNFKSSASSRKDELVQWCHGATGFIPMLFSYSQLSQLAASKVPEALSVIWERGLLTKSCGVCHGVAGNAYCFLVAYLATRRDDYLHQACCFANEIIRQGPDRCCLNADRPLSLFEGLSGTTQFMMDLYDIISVSADDRNALSGYELMDGLAIF
jgi:hypothetical protein